MRQLIVILFAGILSVAAQAKEFRYTYQSQTLVYDVIDEASKTCQTKQGWNSDDANKYVKPQVTIPSVVKDGDQEYTVIGIGEYTFQNATHLQAIEIPNTVQFIGQYAFDYCTHLQSVVIPNSVKRIDRYAFSGCEALSSVTLGDSVEEIAGYAFSNCAFSNISLPASLKTLAEHSFSGCENLQVMYINSIITSLSYPIDNCNSFSRVVFPTNDIALGNEKYFKQFKNAYGRQAQMYVGDKPYVPVTAENKRSEAKMPYSITKDRGQLYW